MSHLGQVNIATENVFHTLTHSPNIPSELSPGRHAKFSLSDEGSGISEAEQQQAFDPFTQPRRRARARGLGCRWFWG